MTTYTMTRVRSHAPVELDVEVGAIARLGEVTRRFGERAFLVTMPEMAELGFVGRAIEALEEAGVAVTVYDRVNPEPRSDEIDAASAALRESGCDVVVGLGGGSALDVAKAAAIGATHPLPIWDYVNLSNRPPQPVDEAATLPIIAVPTTAGTGSETTPYAVVTNSETVQKGTIKERAIFPRVALVDPELSARMPAKLTAATGVDAFAHSLESYFNVPNRTPVSDALAESAIARLARALPRAVADGDDLEARTDVALAASMSGMVIAQAGTTVAHAIAQPLGARLGTSHADSVAMFTLPVLRRTLRHPEAADTERIARIGRLLPEFIASEDVARDAELAVDAVEAFLDSVGMNRRLREIANGQSLDGLASALAEDVTTYMSRPLKQHPVLFEAADIAAIVEDVL